MEAFEPQARNMPPLADAPRGRMEMAMPAAHGR